MGRALSFFVILVAFGIFMPEVLHALSDFLLTLLVKATAFLNALPTQPAMVGKVLTN